MRKHLNFSVLLDLNLIFIIDVIDGQIGRISILDIANATLHAKNQSKVVRRVKLLCPATDRVSFKIQHTLINLLV